MNNKDISINDNNFTKLVHDDAYYKYIFKKTEKIVSAVFYILQNVDSNSKTETHVSNLAGKAHLVHEHSLRTLEVKKASGKEVLEQFAQSLIALESTFRIAAATNLIAPDILRTVVLEIDNVLRGLRSYLGENSNAPEPFSMFNEEPSPTRTPTKRVTSPDDSSALTPAKTSAPKAESTVTRRDRIHTIIEAKGEATIKDISEIITDVSEKTIQRELQSMIEANQVKRQGERRWSKYSLF